MIELWYNPVELAERFVSLNPQIDFGKPLYSTPSGLKASRRWRKRNRDKVKLYHKMSKARRRAKVREARGSFNGSDWLERLALFNYRCVYCGSKRRKLTVDHWIPLSRGGTNSKGNIVPACSPCNSHKHNINGNEFKFKGAIQMAFAMQAQRMLNSPPELTKQVISSKQAHKAT